MTYATKYYTEFTSQHGNLFKIELQPDAYVGSTYELKCTSAQWEMPNLEDKLQSVCGTGLSASLINPNLDLSDLFVVSPWGIRVRVRKNSTLIWSGFLNVQLYSQSFTRQNAPFEITCNDGLAALRKQKFIDTSNYPEYCNDGSVINAHQMGTELTRTIIADCLDVLDVAYININSDYKSPSGEPFYNLPLDLSRFVDEDGVSFTRRQVLEDILTPYGLTLLIFDQRAWIIDRELFRSSTAAYTQHNLSFDIPGIAKSFSQYFILDHSTKKWMHTEPIDNRVPGYNKIEVDYAPKPDPNKIVPFEINPSEASFGEWVLTDASKDPACPFYSRQSTEAINGITLHSGFFMKLLYNATTPVNPDNTPDPNNYTPTTQVGFHRDLASGAGRDYTAQAFTLHGGYIPRITSTPCGVGVELEGTINIPEDGNDIAFFELPMYIKIGDYYAGQNNNLITPGSNPLSGWTTTQTLVWIKFYNKPGDKAFNTAVKSQLYFYTDAPAGEFSITLLKSYKWYNSSNGLLGEWYGSIRIGLSAFKVQINGSDINDTNILCEDSTNIDFTANKQIPIKLESNALRGSDGPIDRGAIHDTNGYLVSGFIRDSQTGEKSLAQWLILKFLQQYLQPIKSLSGEISAPEIFTGASETYDNVLTPLSIISDALHHSGSRFMYMGGMWDLHKETLSGDWHELLDQS